jgi:hypothetical protein
MDPLGIVLVVFITVVLAYQYFFRSGSSQRSRPTDEERAAAARERRSQAYNDVLADFAAGRISTAQRDAQLGHVAKWPIESGPDGRR